MRICYLGNFLHPWCTEVHVTRDAERLEGVEVDRVQEPARLVDRRRGAWLRAFEERAALADVVIYQRTWGVGPELTDVWRRLERRGTLTASYHLDLYHGLAREAGVEGDPFWSTGVVFTADGDPSTTAWLAGLGVDHRWMPAAIVSDEVGESASAVPFSHDVVFVGSLGEHYHDEWPWRRELLEGLERRYGSRFARFPVNGRRLHGEGLSHLYASATVVVGDSLSLGAHRNYWSDRYYLTIGRAGYLVAPSIRGLEQHFTDGEHFTAYTIGALDEVFAHVDEALDDPRPGRAIAREGMEHVRAHHTYTHRVAAMLEALDLTP